MVMDGCGPIFSWLFYICLFVHFVNFSQFSGVVLTAVFSFDCVGGQRRVCLWVHMYMHAHVNLRTPPVVGLNI